MLPATLLTTTYGNVPYFAQKYKFVKHPKNEISPENVQSLQHQQQAVEKVITREWLEEIQ